MIVIHRYHDPYTAANVDQAGVLLYKGHRSYGNRADGSPNTDATGATGKDIAKVAFFGGALRSVDLDKLYTVNDDGTLTPADGSKVDGKPATLDD